jgi:hypothetical protein
MFKPEYIRDNVALFGLAETIELVAKKFKRMGKTPRMAHTMAYNLVLNTVFIGE